MRNLPRQTVMSRRRKGKLLRAEFESRRERDPGSRAGGKVYSGGAFAYVGPHTIAKYPHYFAGGTVEP